MAESRTDFPARVSFAKLGEGLLDVTALSVDEPINGLFQAVVEGTSPDGSIDLDKIVGQGAVVQCRLGDTDVAWAGVCREIELLDWEPEGQARYRVVVVPALYLTTLRTNCRIFQAASIPDIVTTILAEWRIKFEKPDLKDQYPAQDYRVQWHETDYQFVCRLLEEAGISFWFRHEKGQMGPGSTVTSVVLSDHPHEGNALDGAFPYRAEAQQFIEHTGEHAIWNVTVTDEMSFGKRTIRDYDYWQGPKLERIGEQGGAPDEATYEDYSYEPEAFWARVGATGKWLEAEQKQRVDRDYGSDRQARVAITFETRAPDASAGAILAIGQNSAQVHPYTDVVGSDKKLLVVRRHLLTDPTTLAGLLVEAVPTTAPYRPAKATPRPRIHGVQSAIVVGPQGQEIHTDELGRVRVQFHWDREHGYDAESSCWIRVTHPWAGSGYGIVNIPRVGQEVLVAFQDGDPDCPVVVGRLFDMTNGVPWKLPDHQTVSGWRTESSGGKSRSSAERGYNEIAFEDLAGRENLHIQAERDLSTVVNYFEKRDVGFSRSERIGDEDILQIGELHTTFVGDYASGLKLEKDQKLCLSTGGAWIRLDKDSIHVEAKGQIHIHAAVGVQLSSNANSLHVKGGPLVKINDADIPFPTPKPATIGPAAPPAGGPKLPPPYYPDRPKADLPPLPPLAEVEVEPPDGKP
jgi:type VI secretion system secreted protein VgrG